MAQTKTDVSNSCKQRVAIVCSIAAIFCHHLLLLDYCDVIALLSLGEKKKMAASRSKMAILLPRLFATKLTTEQIIAIFRYFMVWTLI